MIVADKATVTTFALALREDLPNKVTGRIEHLDPWVGHNHVPVGGHRYSRDVFELSSAVATRSNRFEKFARGLKDQYGPDTVVGNHHVVIQVQGQVDGLFEVIMGKAS